MNQEEKAAVLLTQDQEGKISEREITREQIGEIFFGEGNREWDNIHTVLPEPVWEKQYEDGYLVYEGFTVDHKPFGAGRVFFRNGSPRLEGIFGMKGLICGREYYPNGVIRFEGQFRLNQAYGPNYPEYGIWYGRDGKRLFRGVFDVSRSTLGWPRVVKPEGFGRVPDTIVRSGKSFLWEDARRLMKEKTPVKKTVAAPDRVIRITDDWRNQNLPEPICAFLEKWEKKSAEAMKTYRFQWPAKGVETVFTYEGVRYRISPATFGIPDDLCEIFQTQPGGFDDCLRAIPGVTDIRSCGMLD